MKKNYLLLTLLGALVITGCNKNNDSSTSSVNSTTSSSSKVESTTSSSSSSSSSVSSSSSSSGVHVPTVAEAVSSVENSYTVTYTLEATGESYGNYLEEITEGELAYYSDLSMGGFYLKNETAYYLYYDGNGIPTYNTVGELDANSVAALSTVLNLNASFTAAEWMLQSSGDVTTYITSDPMAVLTASFLTDNDGTVDSVEVHIKKTTKDYKISGFTTYDADGEVIAKADIKRIGTTFAVDGAIVLNDGIDTSLVNKWLNLTEEGFLNSVEINSSNVVSLHTIDLNTMVYTTSTETFEFVSPTGDGRYAFVSSAGRTLLAQNFGGELYYAIFDNTDALVESGACLEYYAGWLTVASATVGATAEEITTEDVNFSIVTQVGAVAGYYVYNYVLDNSGNPTDVIDETSLFIAVRYSSPEAAANSSYFGGDTKAFNGYVVAGMAFGSLVFLSVSTEKAADLLMSEIGSIMPTEYCLFDETQYPVATEGQSAIDYLVGYMTSAGYSYVTGANATGTAYEQYINLFLTNYPKLDENGAENPLYAVDAYAFYKTVDMDGETMEMFAIVVVFNTDQVALFQGNVWNPGLGYIMVLGEIYEALAIWENTVTYPEAA